jgi:hypothetical protein
MIPYTRGDLGRALAICGLVGTWLVILNQGDEILSGDYSPTLSVRVLLDYLTPFVVSSLTALLRNRSEHITPVG